MKGEVIAPSLTEAQRPGRAHTQVAMPRMLQSRWTPSMLGRPEVRFVRRIDFVLAAAVGAVVLLTWLPRLTGPIDLRWDGGVYYVLGTALADGTGYRLLNEPGEIEANQYPPLFPAIIALHQRLAGTSNPTLVGQQLRLTFLLLSIALGLGAYALFRCYLAPAPAVAAAARSKVHTAANIV